MRLKLNENERKFIESNWRTLKSIFEIDRNKMVLALSETDDDSSDEKRIKHNLKYVREWLILLESFDQERVVQEETKRVV